MAGNGESGRPGQQQHVVHSSIFQIEGKYCRVILTNSAITWGREDDVENNTKQPERVNLSEVVAAIPSEAKLKGCLQSFCSKWSKKALIYETSAHVNCFKLHYAARAWKHRWKLSTIVFEHTDSKLLQQWTTSIQEILDGFHNRPRRLVVFVNPYGGKRKAQQIYKEKVEPLFNLANIQAKTIITQKPDHAKEMLLSDESDICLNEVDGVICVGGDGMFNELLNGLIVRTQMDLGIDSNNPQTVLQPPKLRLGVIPGGSTDAVAFCTSGTNDPVTAVLHIILGDSLGLDVSSIHTDNHLLAFCTTMLAYGYFGDTLRESEKHRWMGPKRYDWSGVKQFLQLKYYEGEVMFKCDSNPQSSPLDSSRCFTGCKICQDAPDLIQSQRYNSTELKGWEVISGKFVAINTATTTCACVRSKKGISPSAHIGDGCTDLILVAKCSRFNYLRYLLATAVQVMNPFNLNFVKVYRVREFRFRPLNSDDVGECRPESSEQPFQLTSSRRSSSSVWNCDGEIITEPAVCVKVHCQLVNIFARGKESDSPPILKNDDLESVTLKL